MKMFLSPAFFPIGSEVQEILIILWIASLLALVVR
jgi:hypothetical protein